ncbi:MAG TPA: HD domain-containing phosphohydrolase [Dehalococcoidia bacterium]|nr:HD domain-containing phosphohydrolase [Dehalococcoidia bacterium]
MRLRFAQPQQHQHAGPAQDWAFFSSFVDSHESVDTQLGALLLGLSQRLGVEVVHCYYPDADRRRYTFVRRAGPHLPTEAAAPHEARTTGTPVTLDTRDGDPAGSEVLFHLPPLKLPTVDVLHGELVSRRSAKLLAWELAQRDEVVALLECGPIAEGRHLRETRAALEAAAAPLAFLIDRLRTRGALESQLRLLQANAEARERVMGAMVDPLNFIRLLVQVAAVTTRHEGAFAAAPNEQGAMTLVAEHGLRDEFRAGLDLDPNHGLFEIDLDLGIVLPRDTAFLVRTGATGILALPLVEGGQLEGIVALVQFGSHNAPSERGLEMLQVVAQQIALLLHSRREYASFSRRYLGSLKALAGALDASGSQGERHHEWVAAFTVALGRAAGADAQTIETARQAAEVHDVGLAAVAVGSGAAAERDHPALGATLLEVLPELAPVARAVRAQHEWFNGWGFPDGAAGDQLPLAGQLLALAEFAADLRTDDPIEPPFAERFFTMLEQRSGTQFDPKLVEAARRIDPAVLHD